jgi:4-amino-4-deoxy-L-arabinose transferase-like glycosyltransferase
MSMRQARTVSYILRDLPEADGTRRQSGFFTPEPAMPSTARAKSLLILALFALVWFGNLQYRDLFQTDEGRYAEIPREMLVSGDWVTPKLDGFKYFEKPPLQYWTTAATYWVFGLHNWTARLWSALTGFFGVLLTWFVGRRLYDARTGWGAALVLASSLYYGFMGHFNSLDMGLAFFMSANLFCFLLSQRSEARAAARLDVCELRGGGTRCLEQGP